jgi:hypothetical protein
MHQKQRDRKLITKKNNERRMKNGVVNCDSASWPSWSVSFRLSLVALPSEFAALCGIFVISFQLAGLNEK